MARFNTVDEELSALIGDVIAADLLPSGSAELALAEFVADKGPAAMDGAQREIWEARILPILSKPLKEQVAIASILRRGGYVPRKIEL